MSIGAETFFADRPADTPASLLAELLADLAAPDHMRGYTRETGERDAMGYPVLEPDVELIELHRRLIPHVGRVFTLGRRTAPLVLERRGGENYRAVLTWATFPLGKRKDLCVRLLARLP